MKINGLSGSITFKGVEREFSYDGDILSIAKLSMGEAEKVLKRLEDKPEETSTANGTHKTVADKLNAGLNSPKVPQVDKDKISAIAASNPAKPKKEAKTKSKREEPAEEEAPEGWEKNEHGVEVPVGHQERIEKKHGSVSKPIEDDEELPESLAKANRLRDVLTYLIDNGTSDPDELKEKCGQLKEKIPCLQRIADLDARITRTLEVMDMSGGELQ